MSRPTCPDQIREAAWHPRARLPLVLPTGYECLDAQRQTHPWVYSRGREHNWILVLPDSARSQLAAAARRLRLPPAEVLSRAVAAAFDGLEGRLEVLGKREGRADS